MAVDLVYVRAARTYQAPMAAQEMWHVPFRQDVILISPALLHGAPIITWNPALRSGMPPTHFLFSSVLNNMYASEYLGI